MNAANTNLDQINMGDYHSKLPIDWKKEIWIWKKEVDRRKVLKEYQNRKFRRAHRNDNDSQTQDDDSNFRAIQNKDKKVEISNSSFDSPYTKPERSVLSYS